MATCKITGKQPHLDKDSAKKARDIMVRKTGGHRSSIAIFTCEHCNMYHIGRQKVINKVDPITATEIRTAVSTEAAITQLIKDNAERLKLLCNKLSAIGYDSNNIADQLNITVGRVHDLIRQLNHEHEHPAPEQA